MEDRLHHLAPESIHPIESSEMWLLNFKVYIPNQLGGA